MKVIDGVEWLNDEEHAIENALIVDIEKLLDKHMVAQEDLPDGFVIHTADTILHAHYRFIAEK